MLPSLCWYSSAILWRGKDEDSYGIVAPACHLEDVSDEASNRAYSGANPWVALDHVATHQVGRVRWECYPSPRNSNNCHYEIFLGKLSDLDSFRLFTCVFSASFHFEEFRASWPLCLARPCNSNNYHGEIFQGNFLDLDNFRLGTCGASAFVAPALRLR